MNTKATVSVEFGKPMVIDKAPRQIWEREGKFPLDRLASQRYPLDQINEACAALSEGKIAGRAIIEHGGGVR